MVLRRRAVHNPLHGLDRRMGDSGKCTPAARPADDDLRRVQAGVQRIGRAMLAASPPGGSGSTAGRVSVDSRSCAVLGPAGRTVGQIPISAS